MFCRGGPSTLEVGSSPPRKGAKCRPLVGSPVLRDRETGAADGRRARRDIRALYAASRESPPPPSRSAGFHFFRRRARGRGLAFAFATIDFGGGWHVSDSSWLPPGWRVSVAPHPTALLVLGLHDPVPWHDEVGYREHDQPAVLSIEGMRDAYVRICAAAWDEVPPRQRPLARPRARRTADRHGGR